LTQFLDYFRYNFNGAIDLRVGIEATEREPQTAAGSISARIHRAKHVRSFLRTRPAG
jgi:hypothetical protein